MRFTPLPFAVASILCFGSAASAALISFDDGTFTDGADDSAATTSDEDVLSFGFRFHDENPNGVATTNALVEAVNADNRLRYRDFAGVLTMTHDSGLAPRRFLAQSSIMAVGRHCGFRMRSLRSCLELASEIACFDREAGMETALKNPDPVQQ